MSERDSEEEWTKVGSKKRRKEKTSTYSYNTNDPKIKPIKQYWNGFNKQGKERWFIELNNGLILSDHSKEYGFWSRRYFSNIV